MKVTKLRTNTNKIFEGPLLLIPEIYQDIRGSFYEFWNKDEFNKLISKEVVFVQDNISFSKKGVLRGLHYQIYPYSQSKLIACKKGSIYDVAIDLRKSSNTFGKYCFAYLTAENRNQFWIPAGFAHGFIALSDNTEVQYKVEGLRNVEFERSIKWDDVDLDIKWPILKNKISQVILSDKDSSATSFREAINLGDVFN